MILIFDTETTGMADFKGALISLQQPRLVQLGAILMDDKYIIHGELNLIIRPEGYTIPVEASNIHGITTEIALQYGIDEKGAIQLFNTFADKCDLLVAHNINYDDIVIANANNRHGVEKLNTPQFCTMEHMTNICKLPGKWAGKFKWPTLQEAHKYCFGKVFEGAHDAMADVRACMEVYKWLQTQVK